MYNVNEEKMSYFLTFKKCKCNSIFQKYYADIIVERKRLLFLDSVFFATLSGRVVWVTNNLQKGKKKKHVSLDRPITTCTCGENVWPVVFCLLNALGIIYFYQH